MSLLPSSAKEYNSAFWFSPLAKSSSASSTQWVTVLCDKLIFFLICSTSLDALFEKLPLLVFANLNASKQLCAWFLDASLSAKNVLLILQTSCRPRSCIDRLLALLACLVEMWQLMLYSHLDIHPLTGVKKYKHSALTLDVSFLFFSEHETTNHCA